jgi:predicted deacylase
MQIGTATAAPGRLVTGRVDLAEYPDGPVSSPVMIAQGRKEGPVLWVQCLVHGPEVVGPLSLARFLRGLDLAQLSGTIVGLMVGNPLGMRAQNRLTPQDGANLNRVFPGKPDGAVSEQLAHRLLDLASRHGDVLLDLHSGGDLTITAFYTIYPAFGSPASRESQRLAASVGSRYQWGSNEGWLKGALFSNFVKRAGKPAIIVESGGGARVTDQDLANFALALSGITRALGMLPGDPPTATDIRYGGSAIHIKSTRGGIWHNAVAPGDDVTEGQTLGTVVNFVGETVETVACPMPRAWIGSIRRPFMPIYSGDQVIELVERKDEP